jgi:Zn-dependent protease with chaperone function
VLHREENAINAFAAGWSNDTAVVAVTRGALERLTRDELQGLVAHEFGHLKHDDLRLQMRLLALVYGLSLVHGYGRHLMDADDQGHRSILGVAIGIAFRAVGSLGLVAGQVLQAAVSRQRELLADASAVQFTRSRDGLGGCLQKIWHQVEERQDRLKKVPDKVLAAMLLHAPSGWLATHPSSAARSGHWKHRASDCRRTRLPSPWPPWRCREFLRRSAPSSPMLPPWPMNPPRPRPSQRPWATGRSRRRPNARRSAGCRG